MYKSRTAINSIQTTSLISLFAMTQLLQSCQQQSENHSISSASGACPSEPKAPLNANKVEEIKLTSSQISKSGQSSSIQPAGYIFSAKKGDVIKYQVKNKEMCTWLYDTENKIITNTTLPKDGKYILQIANLSGSGTFDIDMSLGKLNDVATTASSSPAPSSPVATSTSNSSGFTKSDANTLINRWLEAKKDVFGSNYNKSLGAELTTGLAYSKNITASPSDEDPESSVDYLSRNGMYYTYSDQQVHEVRDIREINANEVFIKAIITEHRILHSKNGRDKKSSTNASSSCYQFAKVNGNWKISKTPELIKPCS
jgi:ARC6-like, IMS domain